MSRVKEEFAANQGCRLKGYLEVNRIPGNFHIGHHAFGDIMWQLEQDGIYFDNTYTINHLSFGAYDNLETIMHRFPYTDLQHPLDRVHQAPISEEETIKKGGEESKVYRPKRMMSAYFINAVPSLFESSAFGSLFSTEVF